MNYLSEINCFYEKDLDLSKYCSMKTGGRADIAFFPSTEEEFISVLTILNRKKIKYFIFGNGSNVLLPDEGLRSVVIFTIKMKNFTIEKEERTTCSYSGESNIQKETIYAECGLSLTLFSGLVGKIGLSGLEFAYGIPGTVGGAIYMNAGAYGGEIKDVAMSVRYYDVDTGQIGVYYGEENEFSYRNSVFCKNGKKIILGATFELEYANSSEIMQKSEQFLQARIDKQPLDYPSCGSVFKRPEGYFAGKLIEDSQLKGVCVGGACVSEKHAGFIINKESATTSDVMNLIELVRKTVKECYGILLETEIKIISE